MKRGTVESFWARVVKTEECWNWTGSGTPKGYGQFTPAGQSRRYVHRYAYELLVGPIPDGLTLDHLCGNRACVNPEHLEPITRGANALRGNGPAAANARKTHCDRGHELNEANVYQFLNHRRCRPCSAIRRRASRRAKRLGGDQ